MCGVKECECAMKECELVAAVLVVLAAAPMNHDHISPNLPAKVIPSPLRSRSAMQDKGRSGNLKDARGCSSDLPAGPGTNSPSLPRPAV